MVAKPVNTDLTPHTDAKANLAKVKKAAAEFESIFLSQMLKTMRSSNSILSDEEKKDGLSLGTDNPFQEMFDWQLAMKLSMGSPLGIAKQLTRKYGAQNGIDIESDEPAPVHELRRSNITPRDRSKVKPISESNFEKIVLDTAKTFNLDPKLIHAVIQAESAGNPNALSPKGAKGLMQLMDSTASDLGVGNPFDPAQNISGGSAYLKKLLDRYDGDKRLALAAYNAGPSAVDRYNGVPPYPETVSYVRKILQQMSRTENSGPELPVGTKENK